MQFQICTNKRNGLRQNAKTKSSKCIFYRTNYIRIQLTARHYQFIIEHNAATALRQIY